MQKILLFPGPDGKHTPFFPRIRPLYKDGAMLIQIFQEGSFGRNLAV